MKEALIKKSLLMRKRNNPSSDNEELEEPSEGELEKEEGEEEPDVGKEEELVEEENY